MDRIHRQRIAVSAAFIATALFAAACSRPDVQSLRDSFAQQVAANHSITDFKRNGDDLTFSGPGLESDVAKWRVHIDSAVIESQENAAQPYKGTVKSSWYADGRRIEPGARESNLPLPLIANGISQECWAFWEKAGKRWSWE